FTRRPPRSTLPPYTTLFRSVRSLARIFLAKPLNHLAHLFSHSHYRTRSPDAHEQGGAVKNPAGTDKGAFQVALRVPSQRESDERSEEHTSELQSRENLVCRL